MRKNRGMRKTQEYTFEVVGRFVYWMEFIEPQVRCSVKLFPAFN